MIDLITNNLDAIRKACEDHDVKTLWVFGSAVNGTWVEGKSDVDFLVELGESEKSLFRQYMGLYAALEDILGVTIDTTRTAQVKSEWFKNELKKTRVLIYESQPTPIPV